MDDKYQTPCSTHESMASPTHNLSSSPVFDFLLQRTSLHLIDVQVKDVHIYGLFVK